MKLDDYVDVAERIRTFKEKYPDGSLQAHEYPRLWLIGDKTFIGYCAAAYRTPDDPRPGIGWAWEPVPGPTPFTKDSELMNAETSAWGRAIVALGFETKKIASANEVRNRQDGQSEFQAPPAATETPAKKETLRVLKETLETLQKGFPSPDPNHEYKADAKAYTKNEFGKSSAANLTEHEAQQTILEFEKRLIEAQKAEAVPFD
jgi:hypothetical protein